MVGILPSSPCKKTTGNGDGCSDASKRAVTLRDWRGRRAGDSGPRGRCPQRYVIWAPGASRQRLLRPRLRARPLRSLSPFPEPEEDKGWGLAGRRRGKPRGRRRAAGLRSKAAGGHFTTGAVRGPSGPPRPQPSPTLAPLGAAPRRRPDPAGLGGGRGRGRAGAGRVRGPAAPAAGTELGAVRRGRGRLRPAGPESRRGRDRGARRERRGRGRGAVTYTGPQPPPPPPRCG